MLTYLTIGIAGEVAWTVYCIFRKIKMVNYVQDLGTLIGYLFGRIISAIVWPFTVVGYVIVSYYPELWDD